MKASEILTKAKALIDTPEKWTQGVWAVDNRNNNAIWNENSGYKGACRFCVWGALNQVVRNTHEAHRLAAYVAGFPFDENDTGAPWVDWNDAPERTHAEVMAAFDKAIALSQTQEAGND